MAPRLQLTEQLEKKIELDKMRMELASNSTLVRAGTLESTAHAGTAGHPAESMAPAQVQPPAATTQRMHLATMAVVLLQADALQQFQELDEEVQRIRDGLQVMTWDGQDAARPGQLHMDAHWGCLGWLEADKQVYEEHESPHDLVIPLGFPHIPTHPSCRPTKQTLQRSRPAAQPSATSLCSLSSCTRGQRGRREQKGKRMG